MDGRKIVRHGYGQGRFIGMLPDRKARTVIAVSTRHDPAYVIVDESLPGGLRQISWQEAARLQGFPQDFVFYGSPTDAGKMIGQAVQIDTGRAILEAVVQEWKKGEKGHSGK